MQKPSKWLWLIVPLIVAAGVVIYLFARKKPAWLFEYISRLKGSGGGWA